MTLLKMPPRGNHASGLLSLFRAYGLRCDELAAFVANGGSVDTWETRFTELLEEGHGDSFAYGYFVSSGREADPALIQSVARTLRDSESFYAQGFANEIGDLTEEQIARRMRQYAGRMRGTANFGWVGGLDDDADIYWTLGGNEDHCDDCPYLAESSPWTKDTLYATPGSNETQCLFGCQCFLKVDNKKSFGATNVWDESDE